MKRKVIGKAVLGIALIGVLLIWFLLYACIPNTIYIALWDKLHGTSVKMNGLVVPLGEAMFVQPSAESKVIVLGVRDKSNELFQSRSSMSLQEGVREYFISVLRGAYASCRDNCKVILFNECEIDSGIVFDCIVFDKYVPELETRYHGYFYHGDTGVLLQFHADSDTSYNVYLDAVDHAYRENRN